ncbi:hypothetical protein [Rhizobium leguminosarum]|uniref:hypothetical protein n=1 Tax=Rhizobium leguminosarum TaxID=384 RepID=UPI00103C7D39|nr:hypothetical protein [Rhizobium leguminosarum]TCA89202.1 hypothetical protein E0H76_31440 [Rhizobium leguminosarum bv. viciae]
MRDDAADFEVTADSAEEVLGREFPWYQRVADKWTYFAVCPRCDNPVKLVALYSAIQTAHGRHENKPVRGFDHFDLEDMTWCATKLPRTPDKQQRRGLTPLSKAIIRVMVEDFDRAVLVLSDALGFRISKDLATDFLAAWFDAEGYCYVGANLTNIPWMLAYFSPTRSLVGRYIHGNADLVERILDRVPGATLSADGRLGYAEKTFISVTFEFIRHEVVRGEDGAVAEAMTMRVKRGSEREGVREMVPLLRQVIAFDEARFSTLRSVPEDRAHRNNTLLSIAKKMADQRLGEGWRDE